MSNEKRIEELTNKRKKINEISPSFCSAKWLQTTLYLQNGFNHSCHHPAPHKIPIEEIEADPAALHNSKYKKEQRAKMLKGDRPSECDYCWKIEDLKQEHFSDRHYKTADWWAWDKIDQIANSDPLSNVYPTYLEVSFSNACNFACAYCSPEISSKWMADIQKDGPYPTKHGAHDLNYLKQIGKFPYRNSEDNPYIAAFWKWFPEAIKHLRVFRITGGEPLMSKDTWKVLEYLDANPNIDLEICINSNLCVTDELIDKLISKMISLKGKVKKIEIYTSLESTGIQAEYARDGLDYQTWLNNVDKVLSLTDCNVAIMTTINILSLPTFEDFIKEMMKFRTKYNTSFAHNRIPLSINYLRWPPHLQVTLLDEDMRIEFSNRIKLLGESWLKYFSNEKYARLYLEEYDQILRFCEYMESADTAYVYRNDFVKFINEYDRRRGKDFAQVFPEYANLLKEWND